MNRRFSKVTVIGAGLGGLSAALRLVHSGMDVTIIERAATPGGKMRQVLSDAGPIDAGPTVMTMRHVYDALFESVGERLDAHVTLRPEPVLARHWWPDGSTLDLRADDQANAAAIRAFGGSQAEAEFRSFAFQAEQLFNTFEQLMMYESNPQLTKLARAVIGNPSAIRAMLPGLTLAKTLNRQFTDKRLAQMFGRYATYVGGSPYASPALLALILHAEARGVWRVEGGMHALAQAIVSLLEKKGAKVRYESKVAQISTSKGMASGVTLSDGSEIEADAVLFNGDPRALHIGMLGEGVRNAVPPRSVAKRSLSAYVFAFAARATGPELHHHNVFFGADPAEEFQAIARGDMPNDPTLYVCAQDRGTGTTRTSDLERFEIIMNGPPLRDAGSVPGEEQRCRTRIFETLARFGLHFDPLPDLSNLTTPAGFETRFPGSCGAIYGLSPHGLTAALAKPRVRSAIPRLYLAGGGVHPGAGVPMAGLSGQHAAEAMLNDLASTSTSARTVMRGGMSTA